MVLLFTGNGIHLQQERGRFGLESDMKIPTEVKRRIISMINRTVTCMGGMNRNKKCSVLKCCMDLTVEWSVPDTTAVQGFTVTVMACDFPQARDLFLGSHETCGLEKHNINVLNDKNNPCGLSRDGQDMIHRMMSKLYSVVGHFGGSALRSCVGLLSVVMIKEKRKKKGAILPTARMFEFEANFSEEFKSREPKVSPKPKC